MDILDKCRKLGIKIPAARKPGGTFAPVVKVGELVFTSGQAAKTEGVLRYTGKVGCELTVEEGQEAAKICVRNCPAQICTR